MPAPSTKRGRVLSAAALLFAATILTGCDLVQLVDARPSEPSTPETVEVIAVVDGDTIDVSTAAGDERIRLIGLDSPEIDREGGPDECYAQEARDWLDSALYGRSVQLVADPTQDDRDKYGRLLRYVLVDGRSAAADAIAAGAAYEYTYATPYEQQEAHRAAQDAAQLDRLGLWGAC